MQKLYSISWEQSNGVNWQRKEVEIRHYTLQGAINIWLANELWGDNITEIRNLSVKEKEVQNVRQIAQTQP